MKYHMLSISSNPNNILEVESFLKQLDFDQSVNSERFGDILISLTEAVNNAILHGNKSDESKQVHIHIKEKENGLTFCVTDEGLGFNTNRVPDPTCPENIECCGGRGVYIMTALCDDITFEDDGRRVEMYFDFKNQVV